ncbi:Sterile alpha motif/pointed domain [Pseudocohnilembus persalinus]|uniref:Sterile alpha motif/pointed domain n=1 Tax=Pseudocohnilembus persalinus TaxID=266149 RepID=A0A0V0QZJ3_PSEPJ|nr:Sterile alpha motif/pointed domain [Pseudocohnilembus persalinus]|eukprot:KRX07643.1 Sterile alpha motif/pointed domain [Pseudocohnilembus persalinus]
MKVYRKKQVQQLQGKIITYFEVGNKFTVFLTSEQILYFCKTDEYLSMGQTNFSIRENIQQVSAKSQNLIYLTKSGVYQHFNADEVNFYDSNRFIRLTEYPYQQIPKQITVGKECAYIISHKNEVYKAELYEDKDNLIKGFSPFIRAFKEKNIVHIFSDRSTYFAIERKQVPPISEWDNEKVLSFMESIQLQDYINIAKYENLDGKKLQNITKNYMIKTMGLIKEDLQTKLITEIIKHKEALDLEEKIYAWGKNDYGQLGLPISSNINQPIHVQIPGLKKGEFIQDIQLCWKNTVIFTNENQVYCTDSSTTRRAIINFKQKVEKKQKTGKI